MLYRCMCTLVDIIYIQGVYKAQKPKASAMEMKIERVRGALFRGPSLRERGRALRGRVNLDETH